jgi:hypothetical protein
MTIEEFLDENTYNLTPEEYNGALSDLGVLDNKAWVDKWGPLMMEKTTGWNQVDAVKQAKPLAERIASSFAGVKFKPGKGLRDDVYQAEFADVPREKFDEALSKMREYYEEEVKARNSEADRKKREKEMKDWGWRNLLASEYAKKRYLENPQESLLGEQAPAIGEAPATRVGATADLLAGAAGAAADALPGGPGVFVGPAIRAGRDVAYKVSGSPYQKSWAEIGGDVAGDLALNAGAQYLTNARQLLRMGRGASKASPVEKVMELDDMEKAIFNRKTANLVDFLVNGKTAGAYNNMEFRKLVEDLPESPMKQELLQKTSDLTHIDYQDAIRTIRGWEKTGKLRTMPGMKEAARKEIETTGYNNQYKDFLKRNGSVMLRQEQLDKMAEGEAIKARMITKDYGYPTQPGPLRSYYENVINEPKLNAGQSVMRMLLGDVLPLANTYPGITAIKEAKTAIGRGSDPTATIEVDPATIDEIKEREGRFWEAGFAPKKAEGQPLWEAYRSWYVDKYGIEPGVKQ